MKFENAISFLLIGTSWCFVNGSMEGVGAHHRRSEVRWKERTAAFITPGVFSSIVFPIRFFVTGNDGTPGQHSSPDVLHSFPGKFHVYRFLFSDSFR